MLGVIVLVAAGVGLLVRDGSVQPESGALLALVGFVTGYAGGLLARR